MRLNVHLAMLTQEKRQWRLDHWKWKIAENWDNYLNTKLWHLEKEANRYTPEEYGEIFSSPHDLTIKQYLKENNLKL